MKEYEILELPNGIRVVHKEVSHTKVVHCGFILDVGSRDESAEELGIAHFWEHMAFKGTANRRAFHILNRLEAVGGELNAYTTKEKVCFYASVLDEHFHKAFDLLTDITFHSTFPEKEILKERNVILEEMAMYHDTTEDAIQDHFDELVFPNHPLGYNILGTSDSIAQFKQEDFLKFVQKNLTSGHLVFSSIGNIPAKVVFEKAKKFLGDIKLTGTPQQRIKPDYYEPVRKIVERRDITQSHSIIGLPAPHFEHPKRLPFFMLVNLLGGPSLNSRLNLSLREKFGLVYSIEANFTPYTDAGQVSFFFATDPASQRRSEALVMKEIRQVKKKKLGPMQLRQVKEQLVGQLAMAEENNMGLMLSMAKGLLDQNKIESLDNIIRGIRAVTAEQLMDAANEFLVEEQFSYLTYQPELEA
ncbi:MULTISPECIES: M16 family metallopeptidase [Persicobacter]|uniref:Peptidase M16 n=1 Tax=Persicobacter diffluens TaxID=981 RepID=A0AAN4VW40_9BACT|nr:pitrilysin family protein [Persicobacter sp. CCB-QB2]GJM60121.1 peptidase M16 [Persicobacter diffluens]